MRQEKMIESAKRGIELYYQQEKKFYTETCFVLGNNVLRPNENSKRERQKYQIVHNQYRVVLQSGQYVTVVGTFRLLTTTESFRKKEKMCVASVMLTCGEQGIKVALLHISEKLSGKKYELRDAREHCYLVDEMDVFYLEAGHNHTRWHCRNEVIETVGNLSSSEKSLSDSFVRIHRGFIINTAHVYKVARCFVELDNGEQLQIPVKKYMAVKERLMNTPKEID